MMIIRGQIWESKRGEIKVLAAFDNYAAVRFKGCSPWIVSQKALMRDWQIKAYALPPRSTSSEQGEAPK